MNQTATASDSLDPRLQRSRQRMAARREALIQALPADLIEREDALPARVRSDNASAQTKLGRIYALVDEFAEHRAPYVACQRGCADCCRMNVQITSLEAARIAAGTSRQAQALTQSRTHDLTEFAGQACPFLVDNACSIYALRPFVCRHHASFDVDAYWCDPQRMTTVALPVLKLSAAEQAVVEVLKQTKRPVMADIRDFFPNPTPGGAALP